MLIKTDSSSLNLQESPSYLRQKIERLSDVFGAGRPSADSHIRSLPFSPDDVTAGSENECQTAVLGTTKHMDLPVTLETSNSYKNLIKRTWRKGLKKGKSELEFYLAHESHDVWENGWACFLCEHSVLLPDKCSVMISSPTKKILPDHRDEILRRCRFIKMGKSGYASPSVTSRDSRSLTSLAANLKSHSPFAASANPSWTIF